MYSATRIAAFCGLVPLILWPAAASAQDDRETAVTIRSLWLQVEVNGRLATTTMNLVFANSGGQEGEGIFQWRMSPAAAVYELVLWPGGVQCPGVLWPRAAARAVYEEIRFARRDPALLEYLGDGLWNLSVFPVPGGGSQKVRVVFTEPLPTQGGKVAYVGPWPTKACSADKADELDFTATICCPGGVKDFAPVRGGAMGVTRGQEGQLTVGFRQDNYRFDKGVGFEFTPGAWPPGILMCPLGHDKRCFVAMLTPPAEMDPHLPRRMAIIVDASASMKGDAMDLAARGVRVLLHMRGKGARFHLIVARPVPVLWNDGKEAIWGDEDVDPVGFVNRLKPAGGTDLTGALRAAAALSKPDDPVETETFLFTDGWDQVSCARGELAAGRELADSRGAAHRTSAVPRAAGPQATPKCRVFALGLGGGRNGPSEALVRLARETGGKALFAAQEAAIEPAVGMLLDAASRPQIADVSFAWATLKTRTPIEEAAWTDPEPGQPIILAGLVPSEMMGELAVDLTATIQGRASTSRHILQRLVAARGTGDWAGPALHKIHAHLLCEREFQHLWRRDATPEQMESLLGLSRQYGIATRCCSLMVLETDAEYAARRIERHGAAKVDEGEALANVLETASARPPWSDEADTKKVRQAIARAGDLLRQNKLAEAQEALEMGLDRWSATPDLMWKLVVLREFAAMRRQLQDEHEAEVRHREASGGATWHEALAADIPRQNVISASRHGMEVSTAVLPWDTEGRARLRQKAAPTSLRDVPINEAVEKLGKSWGIDLAVRWGPLEQVGVGPDTGVSVDLGEMSAEEALQRFLAAIKGAKPVTYRVDAGSVLISTAGDLAKQPVTRVYDIRSLVGCLPSFESPEQTWGGLVFGNERGTAGGLFLDSSGRGSGLFDEAPVPDKPGHDRVAPRVLAYGVRDPAVIASASWAPAAGPADANQASYWPTFRPPEPASSIPEATVVFVRDDQVEMRPGSPCSVGRLGENVPEGLFLGRDFRTRDEIARDIASIAAGVAKPAEEAAGAGPEVVRYFRGLLVVHQTPQVQQAVHSLLRALREHSLKGDVRWVAEDWGESLFRQDARLQPWVVDLLRRAKARTLPGHSSVRVTTAGGRQLARIGGVWFETSLSASAVIYAVARDSEAADAVLAAAPGLANCAHLDGPAIIAISDKLALCFDRLGITYADDEDLKKLIAALTDPKPTGATRAATRPTSLSTAPKAAR